MDRPMVNVPEGPNEENVYREMNDEEFAQWKVDVEAYEAQVKAEAERPHPLIEQIASLSDADKAALRELLS